MAGFDPYHPPEEFNPYAAPEAELIPAYDKSQGSLYPYEPFSIDAVVRRAWRVYNERLGLCIGAVLSAAFLPMIVYYLGLFLVGTISRGGNGNDPLVMLMVGLFMLAYYLLIVWFNAGMSIVLLRIATGRETSYGDLFTGGRYMLRFLGAYLLIGAIVLGLLLLCSAPVVLAIVGIVAASGGGSMIGVIPIILCVLLGIAAFVGFLLLSYRLYLFQYAVIDRDCGPIEAIQICYDITRGHVLEAFGTFVVGMAIGIAGYFLCFVGLIFTLPLMNMIHAMMYVFLSAEKREGRGSDGLRGDLLFLD